MHGNDVHQIPDGTFRDLISLQVQIFPFEKTLFLYFFCCTNVCIDTSYMYGTTFAIK